MKLQKVKRQLGKYRVDSARLRIDEKSHRLDEGRHPRDEWSAHPGLHPVLDAHRVAALAAIYDICLVRHGGLQLQAITDAQWEGEQRETTFADGSRVQADLKAGRLFVNGKAVPRPRQLDD